MVLIILLLKSIMKHCETNFREDKALVKMGLFNGIMVLFRKVSIRMNIVFVFLQNIQVKNINIFWKLETET